ncbi:S-layer homology domain-containing protein [Mangrovibacillus cuniculi]|uniref:S-layer homology domain-containing protein n=1 Tax=Mangrovibacillus cuniculi TaxID=2593652 RepID=A0A7S8HGL8_9BACI|nr:S-layer homology domain-containing protein [Mangrovibacillus cuniculi]QPC47570.1 S-layer homology domain-containing protein [Mangrovibacillus cuniculi]
MTKKSLAGKYAKLAMVTTLAVSSAAAGFVVESKVKAATSDYTEEVITAYLSDLHDSLTTEQKEHVSHLKTTLNTFQNSVGYDEFLNEIVNSSDQEKKEATKLVISELITLILGSTSLNFEEQIDGFKNIEEGKLNEVFGGAISGQDLIDYSAAVLGESYSYFEDNVDRDLSHRAMLIYVLDSMAFPSAESSKFNTIYTTLTNNLISDLELAFKLEELLDENVELKNSFRNASQSVIVGISNFDKQLADYINNPEDEEEDQGGNNNNPGDGSGNVTPPPVDPIDPEDPTDPEIPVEIGVEEGEVKVEAEDIAKQADKIVESLKGTDKVEKIAIKQTGKEAEVTVPQSIVAALIANNPEAALVVETDSGSYSLPVKEVGLSSLARELGVAVSKVSINFVIKEVEDTTGALEKNNVVGPVIEFEVTASANGKTISIVKEKFSSYVARTITPTATLDVTKATAVRINEDGSLTPIPTYINKENVVTILSLTNSKYTLISENVTFADVNDGANWAEEHIEKLASKQIIKGKSTTAYAPKDEMTRAEFAALISRSLGLVDTPAGKTFADVPKTLLINKNGEINAAVEAGIIFGRGNNVFDPNAKITRTEAVLMMARAIDFVGAELEIDETKKLEDYKDFANIPTVHLEEMELLVQSGIITGYADNTLSPRANTTRDQMARMLDLMLQKIKFMN